MCCILNTKGIVVTVDRLTGFVSSISHGKLEVSNGTIVNFIIGLCDKSKYVVEQIRGDILNTKLMLTDDTVY